MEQLFKAMLRENTKYVDGLVTMTEEERRVQGEICKAYRTVITNMGIVCEWEEYFEQHYKPKKSRSK